MAHGLSCSVACGIFLDQGSNLRPLHWQVDSYPLHHQGSPALVLLVLHLMAEAMYAATKQVPEVLGWSSASDETMSPTH